MGFNKFMRGYDSFGYPIILNFDKNGGTRGTVCGGFCTMIMQIFLTIILIIKFKKLLNYELNQTEYQEDTIDFETVGNNGTISFKEANLMPYFTFIDKSFFNPISFGTLNPFEYVSIFYFSVEFTINSENKNDRKLLNLG